MIVLDDIDRKLITALQDDASQSYASLGAVVGMSAGAAHDRVRKLRDKGVIRRTTIEVDPAAVGNSVTAFVLLDSPAWMGGPETATALAALPWVQEAHVVAGDASVLVKVRAGSTAQLQSVLRHLHELPGPASPHTIVVLETFFERPTPVSAGEGD
jgi:Lrp/AsnC family transcriptional regulator, leucine-responsive regulatory protein